MAEWRAILLDKRLKGHAGKSKLMVGINGGKMIVNSGKWSWGVCGKECRQILFSAQYVRIHKRCSSVRGDLSRAADGFSCRRCDGTIQKAYLD